MTLNWAYNLALAISDGNKEKANNMTFGSIKKVLDSIDSTSKKIIIMRFKKDRTFFNIGVNLGMSTKEVQTIYHDTIAYIQNDQELMNKLYSISIEEHNAVVASIRNMNEAAADISIESVRFNSHTLNALKRANINTINQLAALTQEEVSNIKGVGDKTLLHIINILDCYDRTLKDYEKE